MKEEDFKVGTWFIPTYLSCWSNVTDKVKQNLGIDTKTIVNCPMNSLGEKFRVVYNPTQVKETGRHLPAFLAEDVRGKLYGFSLNEFNKYESLQEALNGLLFVSNDNSSEIPTLKEDSRPKSDRNLLLLL